MICNTTKSRDGRHEAHTQLWPDGHVPQGDHGRLQEKGRGRRVGRKEDKDVKKAESGREGSLPGRHSGKRKQ